MMSGQSQPCPLAKKDPCCLWTVASNPSCSAEQPCWDKVMRNLHLLDGWCGQMTDQGAPVLQGLGVVMHGVGGVAHGMGVGVRDGGEGYAWSETYVLMCCSVCLLKRRVLFFKSVQPEPRTRKPVFWRKLIRIQEQLSGPGRVTHEQLRSWNTPVPGQLGKGLARR